MSRKLSHQAEIERRHIDNGSYSPDGRYSESSHYDYLNNNTPKSATNFDTQEQKVKNLAVTTLIKEADFSYANAVTTVLDVLSAVDIPMTHIRHAMLVYAYMIKNQRSKLKAIETIKNILSENRADKVFEAFVTKGEML
ncbi:hypothetical protein [Pseudoalteromonas tetraodonis]|uniref:hypothetical protein n=1 Tax=Pseudoalteromonas tetraodonis TaxID=43659 RepID=UPI000849922A|nr:hypothetical protein [Pseudoalteromonas tetraodonis]ODS14445.1 hypothetical protein BCD66_11125 [Pseudoalteromonas tetraodonis]